MGAHSTKPEGAFTYAEIPPAMLDMNIVMYAEGKEKMMSREVSDARFIYHASVYLQLDIISTGDATDPEYWKVEYNAANWGTVWFSPVKLAPEEVQAVKWMIPKRPRKIGDLPSKQGWMYDERNNNSHLYANRVLKYLGGFEDEAPTCLIL